MRLYRKAKFFHYTIRTGDGRKKQRGSEPSQALPRQLPQGGSQVVKFIAKVLGVMRKLPGVLLPLPLGEVDANVVSRRRGRTPLAVTTPLVKMEHRSVRRRSGAPKL